MACSPRLSHLMVTPAQSFSSGVARPARREALEPLSGKPTSPFPLQTKNGGKRGNRCRCILLAYQGQTLERIMRFVLSLIVAVTELGSIQASSEEIAIGVRFASSGT